MFHGSEQKSCQTARHGRLGLGSWSRIWIGTTKVEKGSRSSAQPVRSETRTCVHWLRLSESSLGQLLPCDRCDRADDIARVMVAACDGFLHLRHETSPTPMFQHTKLVRWSLVACFVGFSLALWLAADGLQHSPAPSHHPATTPMSAPVSTTLGAFAGRSRPSAGALPQQSAVWRSVPLSRWVEPDSLKQRRPVDQGPLQGVS